ncbi:MAG: sugar transferase [Armatimonadetes bacterium]|nr:sugar transferase [Armatimonadota bacterium]MBS1726625.1 sugar transferase [Armatimonadota bacterium]
MASHRVTFYDISKRIFDCIFALVGIVIFAIPMLVVALAVKLSSPGPVLYRAKRNGRFQVPFTQLKFRTMIWNAPDLRNPDGSTLSTKDDPRVTKVGRLLRQLSLDELPQFFNVLRGDMSFVGPRPDPLNVVDLYRPQDLKRFDAMPGITGWAIVHGRNDIPWEKRRDYDIEYVEIRSFGLDLKIIFMTLGMVFKRSGVYTPSERA